MAEIYSVVRGKKIQRFIAGYEPVQDGLDRETQKLARRAKRLLDEAPSDRTGESFIEVERAGLDRYVVLNDTAGWLGAMTIEFGRKDNADGKGGHPGLFILTRAVLGMRGGRR